MLPGQVGEQAGYAGEVVGEGHAEVGSGHKPLPQRRSAVAFYTDNHDDGRGHDFGVEVIGFGNNDKLGAVGDIDDLDIGFYLADNLAGAGPLAYDGHFSGAETDYQAGQQA